MGSQASDQIEAYHIIFSIQKGMTFNGWTTFSTIMETELKAKTSLLHDQVAKFFFMSPSLSKEESSFRFGFLVEISAISKKEKAERKPNGCY